MAAEEKYVPVSTKITSNGEVEIFVYYNDDTDFQLLFFVMRTDRLYSGVSFIGGELGYDYLNVQDIFEINSPGELIVSGSDPEIYSIDSEGDLILTT